MKLTAVISKLVRNSLLVVPLAVAPTISSVVLKAAHIDSQVGSVVAASKDEKEKPKYKTRKTPSMSQKVAKRLSKAQMLMNPDEKAVKKGAKPDYPAALIELNNVKAASGKFNQYELAQLYNMYGFVYYSLDNPKEAIRHYKLVIAQSPNISVGLEQGTLKTVAQLYFMLEDYKSGVDTLKQWMKVSPIIGADSYIMLGQGYYQMGDMRQSLVNVNKAVDMYEAKGKIPKEGWYSLQRVLYFDKEDNKKVISILEKLARHYPDVKYWKQLSGLYSMVGRSKDQLHALEAAYLMDGLEKESDLMNLAYLFLGEDAPYKAAKVIDKGIKAKLIEPTSKHLNVLGSAWQLSQEMKKALPVMKRAAQKSDKGELYALLAGVYLDNDMHKKAIDAGAIALKRGGIKRPDRLHIVLGMANTNLKRYEAAIKSFKAAAKDKRSKKFAVQWRRFAENEMRREKSLKI